MKKIYISILNLFVCSYVISPLNAMLMPTEEGEESVSNPQNHAKGLHEAESTQTLSQRLQEISHAREHPLSTWKQQHDQQRRASMDLSALLCAVQKILKADPHSQPLLTLEKAVQTQHLKATEALQELKSQKDAQHLKATEDLEREEKQAAAARIKNWERFDADAQKCLQQEGNYRERLEELTTLCCQHAQKEDDEKVDVVRGQIKSLREKRDAQFNGQFGVYTLMDADKKIAAGKIKEKAELLKAQWLAQDEGMDKKISEIYEERWARKAAQRKAYLEIVAAEEADRKAHPAAPPPSKISLFRKIWDFFLPSRK